MGYQISSYCRIYNSKLWLNGKQSLISNVEPERLADKLFEELELFYPKFYKMDKISKLGLVASEMVLKGHNLPSLDSMAMILSNCSSCDITDQHYWELSKNRPSPSVFVYTLPNIVIGEICIRHNIRGETLFFITPDFSATHLHNQVIMMMNYSSVACLAGWIEVQSENVDILLYLVSEANNEKRLAHSKKNIQKLYELWKS